MVELSALWLPILLSAVLVFVASSIMHMLLPYHRSDYAKLPNEDSILEGLRKEGVVPGNYHFPHATRHKECSTPAMMEKLKKGPVGLVNIIPNGPPNMGKFLGQWFAYCLVLSFVVAYLTGRTLASGAEYLAVFRVAGTAGLLGYAGSAATDSIWKGQSWSTTRKFLFDGLVYGALTAGVFGWLWPR